MQECLKKVLVYFSLTTAPKPEMQEFGPGVCRGHRTPPCGPEHRPSRPRKSNRPQRLVLLFCIAPVLSVRPGHGPFWSTVYPRHLAQVLTHGTYMVS